MFSLNSMRTIFHNTWLGKTILGGAGLAMIVLAINGIGQSLRNTSDVSNQPAAHTTNPSVATVNGIPVMKTQYLSALDEIKQQSAMYGQTPNALNMGDMRMRAFTQA